MKTQGTPPTEVYAGTATVRAMREASSDAVRIAFSGGFTLAELGPIIAWAVTPGALDKPQRQR